MSAIGEGKSFVWTHQKNVNRNANSRSQGGVIHTELMELVEQVGGLLAHSTQARSTSSNKGSCSGVVINVALKDLLEGVHAVSVPAFIFP